MAVAGPPVRSKGLAGSFRSLRNSLAQAGLNTGNRHRYNREKLRYQTDPQINYEWAQVEPVSPPSAAANDADFWDLLNGLHYVRPEHRLPGVTFPEYCCWCRVEARAEESLWIMLA
jgi:hypothetical protein